jgi:hypothetical protein
MVDDAPQRKIPGGRLVIWSAVCWLTAMIPAAHLVHNTVPVSGGRSRGSPNVWRPFLGRWSRGGTTLGYEFRANGVVGLHTCTGVALGRWEEPAPNTIRWRARDWGTSYLQWRCSDDCKTLFCRTSDDGITWSKEESRFERF